jgi:ADP-heptose:LPS heptosyltransferase
MPAPAEHAAAIIAWLGSRSLADTERGLADPAQAGPLLDHADALADAADHDDEALRNAGLRALFAGLVEPLNDGFTAAGRAVYARLFPRIVWRVAEREPRLRERLADHGIAGESALLARYQAVRRGAQPLPAAVRRIAVLSRVTIGADILLTTVALQRLHQRWPDADLVLLGDGKLAGLVAGLPRVRVRPLAYGRRGPLRERLASWLALDDALAAEQPDLVMAPDSRLDQLGLLPTRAPYLLWENTQAEGQPVRSLADLLDGWLARRLDLPASPACVPRLGLDAATTAAAARLRAALGDRPLAAVKLDHGGNPAKSLPRAAEALLLRRLRELGWGIVLDRGFGAEELANSDALLAALGWTASDLDDSGKGLGAAIGTLAPGALADAAVVRFHGSIAGWAGAVAACGLALSYDSVGHHLAAALGVPVVVAFTGHADPGFPTAWQPRGPAEVRLITIATAAKDDPAQWQRVADAFGLGGGIRPGPPENGAPHLPPGHGGRPGSGGR